MGERMRSLYRVATLSSLIIILPVLNVWAEAVKLPIQTTYSIDSSSSEVETILRKDKSKNPLIEKYLFSTVAKALEKVPSISNVVFVPGDETETENNWSSYIRKKRESFAYVNLNMNTQVSMLFKISEERRVCKTVVKEEVEENDDDIDRFYSGGSSGCNINSLKSEVTISGPISIYGTYASNINVDTILKDRQKIKISVESNYSKEFVMNTEFSILSSSFEEKLMTFFKVFQYKPMIGSTFTRRQLLVGVARALRTINEGVLEL